MKAGRLVLMPLLAMLTVGCHRPPSPPEALTLATTTSTQDNGLLDLLVPLFRKQAGIEVKVVAVGSGQALQLGRRGDADVILAHSTQAEERFMAEGHGESRRAVMHNDFVLVGPPSDPASVRGEPSIARAFAGIARSGSAFVSRGDDSGTHQKERQVWRAAGVEPGGPRYEEAGTGMGQVLRMADQKRAYTLSDRATYLGLKGGLDLAIISHGDPLLQNRYHVIVVSPAKHPGVHVRSARRFAEFLLRSDVQRAIAQIGVNHHGEPLFFPDASGSPGER